MNDLLQCSGSEIARRIRSGEVSSREAVDAHIARIECVNRVINAVVAERFELARAEADAADRRRAEVPPDRLPPFHGVPCTIKESFQLEGMPNAAGLVARRSVRSTRDGVTVARLRAAGAIPLGVTNTSELCMWMESANFVYGRTNNPYDPTRLVGGSSGGEGAIIGAGGSPFGLGSDIGGSIRGPCFFNGIFGHKATPGIVPNSGQYPRPEGDACHMLCTGPMVRRAEDLWPLMLVLAGPDGEDETCLPATLGDPSTVVLKGRAVIDVPGDGRTAPSDDLRSAQVAALRALEDLGMGASTRSFRGFRRQFEIWSASMGQAAETPFGVMLGNGLAVRPVFELVKRAFGRSDHTVMASLTALTDRLPKLLPERARRARELGERLRAELLEALGDDGVLLYPTYTTPAPRHAVPVRHAIRLHMPFAHQGIFNVMGFPATQVPLGLNADGLPLGVQVVSRPGNDHVTVAVALALEKALGGWVPPPQVATA